MATEGTGARPTADAPVDELAELRAVIAKAKAGDTSVLPRLRAILDGNPALVEHFGDIGRHADAAWVALAGGSDWYMREALARGAEDRRAELTRPGATPVERLLVARVVACWLQANYLGAHEADLLGAGDTFRQLQYLAKRVERAQRMHLAAVGALVAFQRLVPVPKPAPEIAPHVPARTRNEQTDDSRLAVHATDTVPLVGEDVELDDAQPDLRERLRVGATD